MAILESSNHYKECEPHFYHSNLRFKNISLLIICINRDLRNNLISTIEDNAFDGAENVIDL